MIKLPSHNRLNICFQLAIISIMYTREIILLVGLTALATPLYYGAIGLILLWNVERLLVKGQRRKSHLLLWGLLLILSAGLVLESWKHPGALITTAGRIMNVLLLLNILRETAGGNLRLLRFNTWWNIFLAFGMAIMCISGFVYNDSRQLVYSYGNPNITGISSYICLLNLALGLYAAKPNGERLLTCLAAVLCLGVCLVSRARASLLSIVAFAVLAPGLYLLRGRKCGKRLLRLFTLIPVLFPPVWILFYKLVGDPEWKVFGKVLFSYRELIWDYMYGVLLSSPLAVHMGQAVEFGSGPHNVPLSVWWDYGILGFVLFAAVWSLFICRLRDRMRYSADCVMVAAVASATVSMTFETLLFSGGMNFSFRLLYLAMFLNLIRDGAGRMKELRSPASWKQEILGVGRNIRDRAACFLSGHLQDADR